MQVCLVGLVLAACSPPDKRILPDVLDLPVAAGDRWKLCADDGLEDTTPGADCVLAPDQNPMAGYTDALRKAGWVPIEAAPAGQELWGFENASSCYALQITGVREVYARKDYTLLRFAVATC